MFIYWATVFLTALNHILLIFTFKHFKQSQNVYRQDLFYLVLIYTEVGLIKIYCSVVSFTTGSVYQNTLYWDYLFA